MKREIKFRGKVEIGVKEPFWIYGYLVIYNNKSTINSFDENGYHRYTVNSDSVGQFTGLQDKNGKDIFENDIVVADCAPSGLNKRSIKNHKCVIEFGELHHGWNCLIIDHEKGEKWTTGYMSWGRNGNSLEVIGNIYDNPELLQ
jgi:uncharacterized phage protein (TIGR01671 family)